MTWVGNIIGVTNPAKVLGMAVANIVKIKGVENTPAATQKDSYEDAGNDDTGLRDDNARQSCGQSFTAGSAYTCTRADVDIKKINSPTGNIWAEIWSISGGVPDTKLGTSDSLDVSALSTSYAWVTFTFSTTVSISNGVDYAIVLTGDFTVGAHHVYMYRKWIGAHSGSGLFWNGSAWSESANADHRFKMWGY